MNLSFKDFQLSEQGSLLKREMNPTEKDKLQYTIGKSPIFGSVKTTERESQFVRGHKMGFWYAVCRDWSPSRLTNPRGFGTMCPDLEPTMYFRLNENPFSKLKSQCFTCGWKTLKPL